MSNPPVFKIHPRIQQYDWGKIGSLSKVAQLAAASDLPGFALEEDKPYAELWMGTHPTAPSLFSDSVELSAHLKEHPTLIGEQVSARFPKAKDGNLPFLLKVLSIEKALSIQTHPDKETAEHLHETLPKIYKDDNHKPELALAISPFQALCGFMPLPAIAEHLKNVPELAALIPKDVMQAFLDIASSPNPADEKEKSALKELFASLMSAEESKFKTELTKLVERYSLLPSITPNSIEELVLKLDAQFPGDIGIFCVFVLNYVHLNVGESIFLGAGEPHAYISGDIIECMANSDNVIRAGLTPKLRDLPNLISGLTYNAAEWTNHRVKPTPFKGSNGASTLYDPPIPEFSVVQVIIPANGEETHAGLGGPSVSIVTEGEGRATWPNGSLDFKAGDVVFIGATTEVTFHGQLTLYRAYVET